VTVSLSVLAEEKSWVLNSHFTSVFKLTLLAELMKTCKMTQSHSIGCLVLIRKKMWVFFLKSYISLLSCFKSRNMKLKWCFQDIFVKFLIYVSCEFKSKYLRVMSIIWRHSTTNTTYWKEVLVYPCCYIISWTILFKHYDIASTWMDTYIN
jgi:hypothetical protein